MNFFSPHAVPGKRTKTFQNFVDDISKQLIGEFRSSVKRRESRETDFPQRMQNVGVHHPERSPEATGSNVCVVCTYQHNKFRRDNSEVSKKDNQYKQTKTMFWCVYCRRYLCICEKSTCWQDWHTKKEYWR